MEALQSLIPFIDRMIIMVDKNPLAKEKFLKIRTIIMCDNGELWVFENYNLSSFKNINLRLEMNLSETIKVSNVK